MKRLLLAAAFVSLSGVAQAATVVASQSTPTSLGSFAAGTYKITASGVIGLAGQPGDGVFDVGPDGVPVTPVTAGGYAYCNPGGCDFDQLGGSFGPGGAGRNLGGLLGSLIASPTGPGDYFFIGNSAKVTLAQAGNIYAVVNDTFYANNGASFDVSVAAVPEPATWAMMILGFGFVGGAMRHRARATRLAFAV